VTGADSPQVLHVLIVGAGEEELDEIFGREHDEVADHVHVLRKGDARLVRGLHRSKHPPADLVEGVVLFSQR
jgi:hypothetical protein